MSREDPLPSQGHKAVPGSGCTLGMCLGVWWAQQVTFRGCVFDIPPPAFGIPHCSRCVGVLDKNFTRVSSEELPAALPAVVSICWMYQSDHGNLLLEGSPGTGEPRGRGQQESKRQEQKSLPAQPGPQQLLAASTAFLTERSGGGNSSQASEVCSV